MADSVDRVFVHALNTVKKIPRTGSARPPPSDRLRLYGLYKQAMEGDVDGVMDRPGIPGGAYARDEDTIREQEKWDAWDAQKGVSRTEAKRRYIEALIETMHRYASTTQDSRELVAELEFVWDQIKNNSSGSGSHQGGGSPARESRSGGGRKIEKPRSGTEGPMKELFPMSEEGGSDVEVEDEDSLPGGPKNWKGKVESTLMKMTTEMAALREQIANGREWRNRRRRTIGAWLGWLLWVVGRQAVVDLLLLALVLIWMRKRRDRRLEDVVRDYLRMARVWVRRYLPARPPK